MVAHTYMIGIQDSLRCLELSSTGHPEDRDAEALVGMDQAVFLAVDVEAALLHLDTVAEWAVYTQQGSTGSLLLW